MLNKVKNHFAAVIEAITENVDEIALAIISGGMLALIACLMVAFASH